LRGNESAEDASVVPETPWLGQGDVFDGVKQIPVLDSSGPTVASAPLGVAVVSQTCDNIRGAFVQVAPVVRLTGNELSNAASGRTARYAPIPGVGDDAYIELSKIATVDKSRLREDQRVPGVQSLTQARELAMALARRFGRFAFPDEVVEWLTPLRRVAQKKAGRPESPEGAALSRVRQIRVRSESGWSGAPYTLGLTFLFDEGELPFDFGSGPDASLRAWTAGRPAAELAARLARGVVAEQATLFQALCEQWVDACRRSGDERAVAECSVDLASADEYTLASFWASEALDLDHLSGPTLAS